MPNKSTTDSGIGFSGLLTIAFIVLKLCNVIAWSWLWVLSPLWIPLAVAILILAIYASSQVGAYLKNRRREREIKQIMDQSGISHFFAQKEYNEKNGITAPKSKWQERYETMMEQQKKAEEMRKKEIYN